MSGAITACAAALPRLRIDMAAFREAWGQAAAPGLRRKPVCAYDEDAVTLAIAAARRALGPPPWPDPAAIFLGATTLPYEEKPSATTIRTALTARDDVAVFEIRGTPLAGLQALALAAAHARDTAERPVLAILADAPEAAPDSAQDHALSAGAAAFVFAAGAPPLARIGAARWLSRESFGARFRRRGEARLNDLELRSRDDRTALDTLLARGWPPVAAVAGALPAALERPAAAALGAAPDGLWPQLGDAGAAGAGLALVHWLDGAAAGESALALAVAGGSAAGLVVEAAAAGPGQGGLAAGLAHGEEVDYLGYLRHRRVLSSRFGGTG